MIFPSRMVLAAGRAGPLSAPGPALGSGIDPAVRIGVVQRLLDQGATPFVHGGQADAGRVIDFDGRHVLPALRV